MILTIEGLRFKILKTIMAPTNRAFRIVENKDTTNMYLWGSFKCNNFNQGKKM